MLGNGRLRKLQVGRQLGDIVLTQEQVPQDRHPRGVAHAAEQTRRGDGRGTFINNGRHRRHYVSIPFHRHAAILAPSGRSVSSLGLTGVVCGSVKQRAKLLGLLRRELFEEVHQGGSAVTAGCQRVLH